MTNFTSAEMGTATVHTETQTALLPWLLILISASCWVAGFVWYGCNVPTRWKLRKIVGPKPSFLVGNLLDGAVETAHLNFREWPKKYGKTSKYFLGRQAYILCSDPDLLQQAATKQSMTFHDRQVPLVTPSGAEDEEVMEWEIIWSSGKFWSTIRAAADPLFHASALASYGPIMHNAIDYLIAQTEASQGKAIEISEPLREMSLQIIGSAAFGVNFLNSNGERTQLGRAAEVVLHPTAVPNWVPLLLITFPALRGLVHWYLKNFTTKESPLAAFFRANGYLLGASKALLRNARAQSTGVHKPHVLPSKEKRLASERIPAARVIQLEGQDRGYEDFKDAVPVDNSFFHKLLRASYIVDGTKNILTDIQITPQATVFILAGFDTTANALSFTLFELAKHESIQARIREEIAAFHANFGQVELLHEHLDEFPYTQACMLESLRLDPPVHPTFVQQRVALYDTKLGDYDIPRGCTVIFNTHGMSRDPELFPEPETFRPERFLVEKGGKLSVEQPPGFMSFGIGPRRCIGYKFAIEEGVFALVAFHKRFSYHLDAAHHGSNPVMEYSSGVVFTPKHGVWLKVSPLK